MSLQEEEKIRSYPHSKKTYGDYADDLRKGASLYPSHIRNYDLVLSLGDCRVCASGALVAGLGPEKFALFLEKKREELKEDVDPFADPSPLYSRSRIDKTQVVEMSGEYHPLLWEKKLLCKENYEKRPYLCGRTYEMEIHDMIVHLYDGHQWSIERIAQWLEAL